jgi:hypothetical protein
MPKPFHILAFVPLLLVGCASSQKVWYSPEKSFEQTTRQLAACRKEAATINNPLAAVNLAFHLANNSNKEDYIKNCMMEKGFILIDEKKLPPGAVGVPEEDD